MTLTLTPPVVATELLALSPEEQRARAEALLLRGLETEEAESYSKTSSFAAFHGGMSLAEGRDLDACLTRGLQEAAQSEGFSADQILANLQIEFSHAARR